MEQVERIRDTAEPDQKRLIQPAEPTRGQGEKQRRHQQRDQPLLRPFHDHHCEDGEAGHRQDAKQAAAASEYQKGQDAKGEEGDVPLHEHETYPERTTEAR